jgi:hypothetical protein
MAKLSEKRRAQLKEAQRRYRENKRLNGIKQVSIWVKESDSLITTNQEIDNNPITSNQDLIINNQLESVQNQLAKIQEIIKDYENHAHPSSVRWDIAKKLLADLKKVFP